MLSTDILVIKNAGDVNTGLFVDSIIRIDKLVTIPKFLIEREPVVINDDLQKEVLLRIDKVFE